MDTPRLFDYFAVYGLNEESPSTETPSPTNRDQSESINSIKLTNNENIVSHLRLRITNENEFLSPKKSEFLKIFEIGCRDKKKL